MKIVQAILSKIGISQRNLAVLLHTNDSLLSRYEAATRSLPTTVMLPIAELQKMLAALPTTPLASPSKADIKALQQRAAYCTAQATMLQQQLSAMQLQYTQAATLLQLIQAMRKKPITTDSNQERWLDEQQYQTNKKLEKFGWLPQQQLQHRISLFQYEAKLLLLQVG